MKNGRQKMGKKVTNRTLCGEGETEKNPKRTGKGLADRLYLLKKRTEEKKTYLIRIPISSLLNIKEIYLD